MGWNINICIMFGTEKSGCGTAEKEVGSWTVLYANKSTISANLIIKMILRSVNPNLLDK